MAAVKLTDEQRETLLRWSRRAKSAQALALRSKIVLAAGEGLSNTAIAQRMGCHPVTVGKWRSRFVESGLDGLVDEPRPGAPRRISDEQVEQVVVATLCRRSSNSPGLRSRNSPGVGPAVMVAAGCRGCVWVAWWGQARDCEVHPAAAGSRPGRFLGR